VTGVYLQASPRGNGCGMALVQHAPQGGGILRLRITVLPKVWRNADSLKHCATVDLDLAVGAQGDCLSVAVHEKQYIRLCGRDERAVEKVADALTGLQFDDTEQEDGEKPRRACLFDRVVRQSGSDGEAAQDLDEQIAGLWTLVSQFSDLLTIPAADTERTRADTYMAELLRHAPEIEPVVRRSFVQEAEAFVRRRRPEFRHHVDEMAAIRGRIVTSGLVRRRARGQQAVLCEFDELDTNSGWQQLIRHAVRIVAGCRVVGEEAVATRAARVERLLADCHTLHPQTARQLCSRPNLEPPRKARFARHVLELSKWLILARYPFGVEEADRAPPPALAAGVRVPTSRLFERLLAGVPLGTKRVLESMADPVPIRFRSGGGKKPDLVCRNAERYPTLYVDAKYKVLEAARFAAMPMSDQYQQYAYAAATGIETLFVYLRRRPRISTSLTSDRARVGGKKGPRLAVAAIRFPSPKQSRYLHKWRRSTGEHLTQVLRRHSRATRMRSCLPPSIPHVE
jgi:hypothetical protein